MKSLKRLSATLLLTTIFVSGCVTQPVQVISRDCLWAEQMRWTEEQADALVDCCPTLARQLLLHNALHAELCRQ